MQNMTNEEARKVFDSALSKIKDPEQVEKIELVREYFTNPEFRSNLEKFVYEVNSGELV